MMASNIFQRPHYQICNAEDPFTSNMRLASQKDTHEHQLVLVSHAHLSEPAHSGEITGADGRLQFSASHRRNSMELVPCLLPLIPGDGMTLLGSRLQVNAATDCPGIADFF